MNIYPYRKVRVNNLEGNLRMCFYGECNSRCWGNTRHWLIPECIVRKNSLQTEERNGWTETFRREGQQPCKYPGKRTRGRRSSKHKRPRIGMNVHSNRKEANVDGAESAGEKVEWNEVRKGAKGKNMVL